MATITPIRKAAVSLAESAVNRLRDMILTGRLVAGTNLQENHLATRLGVSRTPIREALTILAREGLLEPGPKRGFKVRAFRGIEIQNALEVRAMLEGGACRFLAERGMSTPVRDTLRGTVIDGEEMIKVAAFGDEELERWMTVNYRFHTTIVMATENDLLIRLIEQAQNTPLASAKHIHQFHKKKIYYEFTAGAAVAHRLIFEAIDARQSYRAESLMREHIWAAARVMRMQLEDHDVSNADFLSEPDILAKVLPVTR